MVFYIIPAVVGLVALCLLLLVTGWVRTPWWEERYGDFGSILWLCLWSFVNGAITWSMRDTLTKLRHVWWVVLVFLGSYFVSDVIGETAYFWIFVGGNTAVVALSLWQMWDAFVSGRKKKGGSETGSAGGEGS